MLTKRNAAILASACRAAILYHKMIVDSESIDGADLYAQPRIVQDSRRSIVRFTTTLDWLKSIYQKRKT